MERNEDPVSPGAGFIGEPVYAVVRQHSFSANVSTGT